MQFSRSRNKYPKNGNKFIMKKQNEFTVVIPIFNAENTKVRTIESVLNQTHKASQIILVDDGSTDKSSELIKNLHHRI
jgi:glycosyltransferase involved in cell wall biosynthesis